MKPEYSNNYHKLPVCYCVSILKIFLVILILVKPAESQGQPEFRFKHLSTQSGLSNNIINCIAQDRMGFMWFGTMEGLNRYDGSDFKVFKKDLNDPLSLADNMVFKVYIDKQNRIWVGTQNGLCLFDYRMENFSHFILDSQNLHINTANRITGIAEDSQKKLFFASERGFIYHYDRVEKKFLKIEHNFSSIKDFIIDSEDRFWTAGLHGVYCFDRTSGKRIYYDSYVEGGKKIPVSGVNTIMEEGDTIWIGSLNSKVFYILKDEMKLRILNYDFKNAYFIYDIYRTRDGIIYIATTDGLYLYDKKEGSVFEYKYNKNNPFGLTSLGITDVFEDMQKNIWIGTYQGGINLAASGKAFKNYNAFSQELTLQIVNVNSILEDHKGHLWVGSFDRGIQVINPRNNTGKVFLNKPDDPNSVGYGSVYSIFCDSHNDVWVGTYLGYLQKYVATRDYFRSFPFKPEMGKQSPGLDVRSIAEDDEGYLWIISHSNGMSRFNPVDGSYKHFIRDDNNIKNTIPDNWAFQLIIDHAGFIWIATPSGLSKFDRHKEIFHNYFNDPSDTTSLCNNFVNTVFEDSNHNLWVGTKFGLDYLNRRNNKFYHFYTKDGLPSNQIKSILEYKPGELWLGTGYGLSRMRYVRNIETGGISAVFRNYDESDNLQDIFFWERSAIKTSDERLVFGGEKGIIVFNPDEITDNTRIPEIYFTDFELFNKSVAIGDYDSLLKDNIINTKSLRLKHNQNYFTIRFIANNYISNEKNQYRFILENFDEAWIEAGSKREASYTNVDPGKYIFRVKASNNDGYWNEEGISLKLNIRPPFYSTWLFRTLAVVLIVLIAFSYNISRLKNLRVQNLMLEERVNRRTSELSDLNRKIGDQNDQLAVQKMNVEKAYEELSSYRNKLEELVELRTKELTIAKEKAEESDRLKSSFLANLSHEIRTPLNSIIGFSGLLFDSDVTEDERKSYKEIIDGSNNTLLNLINDIIDFSKIESGHLEIILGEITLSQLLDDLYKIFSLEIKRQKHETSKDLDFKVNIDDRLKAVRITTDETRLKQILSNLISNAIKFTHKGYIEVGCGLVRSNKYLRFFVKDTGIGIRKDHQSIIFERFRKVEDDGNRIYRGAGLGLAISQELARCLGGEISLESKENEGSVFYLTLPLKADISESGGAYPDDNLQNGVPDFSGSLILVAEDDYANYAYLEKIILKTRASVLHAKNGKELIDLYNKNQNASLILMDIKMPRMNGIDALKLLKASGVKIPVIAQTAYAFSDEIKAIKASGFTDYITKPINADDFFRLLRLHIV